MPTLRQRISRAVHPRLNGGTRLGRHEIEIERDIRVPMADGVELLADLLRPVGADEVLPTVLIRGPYGRRGIIAASARALASEGFVVLFQSCRGTSGSEGHFTPQIDEQRDGIATIHWVREQPWFTGRLVMYGESYMGYTQWAVAGEMAVNDPENAPEAHVLLITMPDFGAITWDNGAFALRNALGWTRMMVRLRRSDWAMLMLALPDPRLKKAFDVVPLPAGDTAATGAPVHWYQDWTKHERLTDEYWTQQNHTASVADATAPVLMVTGLYDIFLPWQLRTYRRLVEAGNPPRLTLGPWGHVSPEKTAPTHSDTIAFLRERFAGSPSTRVAPVRAFQTGAERWHDLEEWPPPAAFTEEWHLHANGRLGTDAAASTAVTPYTYDPADPTPALGGPSLLPKTGPVDNRAHEERPDVAVFTSDVPSASVDIAGEPVGRIRIRSSAPSFDVFVRITDVQPDGTSMTVCDGIRRVGSVGTVDTDPIQDAEGFREVEVRLWPTFHRFEAGHRMRIQVSSGAHPRYARNLGTGEPVFTASKMVVAHQEVAHGPGGARIELPVWRP